MEPGTPTLVRGRLGGGTVRRKPLVQLSRSMLVVSIVRSGMKATY